MLNATRLVELLGNLRRGRREKILLLVNGHPSHKAKTGQGQRAELPWKAGTEFPAVLRADLNLNEVVSQHAKTNGAALKP